MTTQSLYPKDASGPARGHTTGLKATLVPRKAPSGSQRKHYYHYDVVIDGEVIVSHAWEPDCTTARALLDRGITGTVTFFHGDRPRYTLDIEKAAKITVIENQREGPRFGRWMPFSGDGWATP